MHRYLTYASEYPQVKRINCNNVFHFMTVFAYGATGAGKTFTMLGRADQPGVMFLTMMDLYSRIESMKEIKSCDVAVSYMEVRVFSTVCHKHI